MRRPRRTPVFGRRPTTLSTIPGTLRTPPPHPTMRRAGLPARKLRAGAFRCAGRIRLSGQTTHGGAPPTGPSCQATGRKSSRTRQNVVPGYRMAAGHTYVVIRSLDDDDSQEAGAVHAVDADQLDVGGRRAAGDPGHRTGRVLSEDVQARAKSRGGPGRAHRRE